MSKYAPHVWLTAGRSRRMLESPEWEIIAGMDSMTILCFRIIREDVRSLDAPLRSTSTSSHDLRALIQGKGGRIACKLKESSNMCPI